MCVPTTTAAPQLYHISGEAKQVAANFFLLLPLLTSDEGGKEGGRVASFRHAF